MNLGLIKILTAAVGGVLVGAGGTYIFIEKSMEKKWQAIADEQIQSVKDHYRIIRNEGELADPENLVRTQSRGADFDENYPKDDEELKELAEQLVDAGYVPVSEAIHAGASDEDLVEQLRIRREERKHDPEEFDDRKVRDIVSENVFDRKLPEGPDGSPRDSKYPYIITIDDFAVPEEERFEAYDTVTVKYHEPDNILLDSRGEIELDVNGVIGTDNLKKFGLFSQDDDVVYVRNERLAMVFEVVRIHEGYAASRGMSFDPEEEDGPTQRRKASKNKTARFVSED